MKSSSPYLSAQRPGAATSWEGQANPSSFHPRTAGRYAPGLFEPVFKRIDLLLEVRDMQEHFVVYLVLPFHERAREGPERVFKHAVRYLAVRIPDGSQGPLPGFLHLIRCGWRGNPEQFRLPEYGPGDRLVHGPFARHVLFCPLEFLVCRPVPFWFVHGTISLRYFAGRLRHPGVLPLRDPVGPRVVCLLSFVCHSRSDFLFVRQQSSTMADEALCSQQ